VSASDPGEEDSHHVSMETVGESVPEGKQEVSAPEGEGEPASPHGEKVNPQGVRFVQPQAHHHDGSIFIYWLIFDGFRPIIRKYYVQKQAYS